MGGAQGPPHPDCEDVDSAVNTIGFGPGPPIPGVRPDSQELGSPGVSSKSDLVIVISVQTFLYRNLIVCFPVSDLTDCLLYRFQSRLKLHLFNHSQLEAQQRRQPGGNSRIDPARMHTLYQTTYGVP